MSEKARRGGRWGAGEGTGAGVGANAASCDRCTPTLVACTVALTFAGTMNIGAGINAKACAATVWYASAASHVPDASAVVLVRVQ